MASFIFVSEEAFVSPYVKLSKEWEQQVTYTLYI